MIERQVALLRASQMTLAGLLQQQQSVLEWLRAMLDLDVTQGEPTMFPQRVN